MTASCGIMGARVRLPLPAQLARSKSLGPPDVYQRAVTNVVEGEAGSGGRVAPSAPTPTR
jgi:hypothetical protein